MLSINGVPCHEHGCPNMGARWDSERQDWVKQRKCFECGMTVDKDDPCCSAPLDEFSDDLDREDEVTEEIALPDAQTSIASKQAASDTLRKKLHPSRFSAMSGKFAAIVGYILGEAAGVQFL